MGDKGNIVRAIKHFGAPWRFINDLYQRGGKDKIDVAYIDEAINYLKIDPRHPKSDKVEAVRTRHPVFRIKCKKNRSYRIFYTWGKRNIVILEIDPRDEKTYNKNMLKKLRARVKIAEAQGFLE